MFLLLNIIHQIHPVSPKNRKRRQQQIYSLEEKTSLSKSAQRRRVKKAEHSDTKLKRLEQVKAREKEARLSLDSRLREIEDISQHRYGQYYPEKEKALDDSRFINIEDINSSLIGQRIQFRGRILTDRPKGYKLDFYLFRHKGFIVQGVLQVQQGRISQHMLRWAESLPRESIVLVEGVVQRPPEEQKEVKSATIHNAEIKIDKMFVVSTAGNLPFNLADASRPESDFNDEEHHLNRVAMHTRLDNRVFDLRTATNQSIFRINSSVGRLFRAYLDSQGFLEIHSPKLQGSATESGASVFRVDYFKRSAFLAQSPQLAKQMAVSADMERVYEIGPVFRAENSNTYRHLTEYTGLDLEMALPAPKYNYHDALSVIDGMFRHIFEGLETQHAMDVERIRKQYPSEKFVWKRNDGRDETVVLTFLEAVEMLREAGRHQADGEDLDTPTERYLGKLVKEKYGTDYYILDKFPKSARPFYTMPDRKDERYTNSFDIFMRGEEVLSGGQRIHDYNMLIKNMGNVGIDPEDMKEYLEAFRLGVEPHAGGGIGLERVVMLYLNLGNIRWASLFPRDPKSLPPKQKKMILKTTPHPMNGFKVPPREYIEDKYGHRIPLNLGKDAKQEA